MPSLIAHLKTINDRREAFEWLKLYGPSLDDLKRLLQEAVKLEDSRKSIMLLQLVGYASRVLLDKPYPEIEAEAATHIAHLSVKNSEYPEALRHYQSAEKALLLDGSDRARQRLLDIGWDILDCYCRLEQWDAALDKLVQIEDLHVRLQKTPSRDISEVRAAIERNLHPDYESPFARIEDLERTVSALRQQRDKLEAEVQGYRLELVAVRDELHNHQESEAALRERIETMRVELDKARQAAQIYKDRLKLYRNGPLWIAAARTQLELSEITPDLQIVLQHLRRLSPLDVTKIEAELAARSDSGGELEMVPDLAADGPYALHWSVARSKALEREGQITEAIDVLATGLEAYLTACVDGQLPLSESEGLQDDQHPTIEDEQTAVPDWYSEH